MQECLGGDALGGDVLGGNAPGGDILGGRFSGGNAIEPVAIKQKKQFDHNNLTKFVGPYYDAAPCTVYRCRYVQYLVVRRAIS